MQLSSFLKISPFWWKQIKPSPISAEYLQWRHGFILKRLQLMIWVAIIALSIFALLNLTIIIPLLDTSSPQYNFYQQDYNYWLFLGTLIIQLLGLLFAFVLFKIPFARQHPILIFLWVSWNWLLIPQVTYTILLKQIIFLDGGWIAAFATSAILFPVHWEWLLIAQVSALGHFVISYIVFGLRDPFIEYSLDYFQVIYLTTVVCFIINLGVFLYERLLKQEFELRRQLRLFLYTVSHDLRNPVLGEILLLKTLVHSSAKKVLVDKEILNQMLTSGDRQLQLIDSLLETYSIENKGIVLNSRSVRLDTLIESTILQMQPFLAREKATITKQVSSQLPQVNIDPLQIRRVYKNLIANAIEHNRKGLHLTIKVDFGNDILSNNKSISTSNSWLYCTVSDNGKGVTSQQSSKIFDLYTRKSSSKQSLNVGLGLYICRQIITAHGGKIGVNSRSSGACFWFTLPVASNE